MPGLADSLDARKAIAELNPHGLPARSRVPPIQQPLVVSYLLHKAALVLSQGQQVYLEAQRLPPRLRTPPMASLSDLI